MKARRPGPAQLVLARRQKHDSRAFAVKFTPLLVGGGSELPLL